MIPTPVTSIPVEIHSRAVLIASRGGPPSDRAPDGRSMAQAGRLVSANRAAEDMRGIESPDGIGETTDRTRRGSHAFTHSSHESTRCSRHGERSGPLNPVNGRAISNQALPRGLWL